MNIFPRVVFFGTPEIALASLQALKESGHNITAVVTAPDRPSGRGMKLKSPPVKTYALKHNLTVLQPEQLSDPVFTETIASLKPDPGGGCIQDAAKTGLGVSEAWHV